MADKRRIERLEQVILQTVSPMVAYGLADPRLTDNMVTITRVKLSGDLSIARINWSCMGGDGDRSKAAHALEQARGPVQSAIGNAMRTRKTPRVQFHYDESLAKSQTINEILEKIELERAARNPAPEPDGEQGGEDRAESGKRDDESVP